jgi:hypothetical protein
MGIDYCNPFNEDGWSPVKSGDDMNLPEGWESKINPYYLKTGKQVSYEFWSYSIYQPKNMVNQTDYAQDESTKVLMRININILNLKLL